MSNIVEQATTPPSGTKRSPEAQRRPARIGRALLGALIGVIVAVALVLVGFNAFIYLSSPRFYEKATAGIGIPGIGAGFVPQDIDYLESGSSWLFSGYDASGDASPLYRRGQDGAVAKVFVETPEGELYAGHGSGITHSGAYVYLTYETGYLVIDAQLLSGASDGDVIPALGSVDVGFAPAFLNAQDGMMYTGVFYNGDDYLTPPEMEIVAPDGTVNHAVMYAFSKDDAAPFGFRTVPDAVYSIPDKVQGVCLTSQGSFVFSTSYGFAPSHLLAHEATLTAIGTYAVDDAQVPLFCFDTTTLKCDLAMPPMSEGILTLNGKIYVPFESACSKYLFGRLCGGDRLYALDASAVRTARDSAGDIIRDSLSINGATDRAAEPSS